MNNKDLLKAIGDIDDKYLIETNDVEETSQNTSNKSNNIMKNFKLRYILAPVCIAFIAVIGLYKSGIFNSKLDITVSKEDGWIIKEEIIDENATEEDTIEPSIAVVPHWDELSISEQFDEVEYNDNKYSSRATKISNDNILKNIGGSTATGYDIYTETTYNKKVELYSIKNIEEKCAIAIKFEGDNDYYVYVNSYYRPTTLGEFIKDLNLEENTSFGTIRYNYWKEDPQEYVNVEFYDVDDKVIWEKLFDNKNLENVYSDKGTPKYTSERFSQSITISVDIPILGYKNISVSLTDKGYLLTNILDTGKGFYIGEDKVQEFLNYIKENYDGYKIVYVDKNDKSITGKDMATENSILEEKTVVTKNTVNGYVTKEVETDKAKGNENKIDPYIPNN